MITPHNNEIHRRWVGFAASIPGGGHISRGIPCQDASAVMTSPRPAVIVCDGRGSARLSHFGAQGSVDAFRFQMSILEPFLVNILDVEEENQEQWIKFCRIMYRTLIQVKYDLAENHNAEEKEFDCTVAFAIAGEKHIGCFQVGDGSIVLRQNGVCKTVFSPEKGEYANQTHFPRPGGEEEMKFQYALLDAGANSGIAVTSDGPEHLMFRLTDMAPGKIFDIFLDDLRREELCKQDLMDYLTRREWTDDPRGSDDRSLALLARIGNEPVIAAGPETKTMPESELESQIESEAKQEIQPEGEFELKSERETELRKEVPPKTEGPKKKVILYRTLAIMSAVVVGLSAGTAYLLKQNQTIDRLQQEIQCLNQQLAQEKLQQEKVSPKAFWIPVPVTKKSESKVSLSPQPQTVVPVNENEESNVPDAEKTVSPGNIDNQQSVNIHKEDTQNEK